MSLSITQKLWACYLRQPHIHVHTHTHTPTCILPCGNVALQTNKIKKGNKRISIVWITTVIGYFYTPFAVMSDCFQSSSSCNYLWSFLNPSSTVCVWVCMLERSLSASWCTFHSAELPTPWWLDAAEQKTMLPELPCIYVRNCKLTIFWLWQRVCICTLTFTSWFVRIEACQHSRKKCSSFHNNWTMIECR